MDSKGIANPGSLQNLHDVFVPESIGLWPPAPGWYAVLACLGLVVAWALVRWSISWRRNAYRRQALAMLEMLSGPDGRLELVAALVKRVALSAYPRERVAGLSGMEWLVFLDRTGGTTEFTSGPGRQLEATQYRKHEPAGPISEDLIAVAAEWIRDHHPESES